MKQILKDTWIGLNLTTLKWNQAIFCFEPLVRSLPVFFNSDVKAKNLPELARIPLPN